MGTKGYRHTDEAKRKISEGRRRRKEVLGFINSPESRDKMRQAKLGNILSEEHKEKISKALKGKIPKNIELCLKKAHEVVKPKGELSYHWKGNEVGYGGLHDWVRKQLGRPKKCERCGTIEAKKYEWCNISGKYRRDLSDWERLCVSCHRKEGYKRGEYTPRGKAIEIKET